MVVLDVAADELDSPVVQLALETERRLTTIEEQNKNILRTVEQLRDHVAIQNGRVAKNDTRILKLEEHAEDIETHILKPMKGTIDSIGSQVETLWNDRAGEEIALTQKQKDADKSKHQWDFVKLRFETVLAILGIAGGAYALVIKLVGG